MITARLIYLVTLQALLFTQLRAEPIMGVGTHLTTGRRPIARSLDKVAAAGLKSIRDDVFWSNVEPVRGQLAIPPAVLQTVEEASKRNLRVLLVLGYGNDIYGTDTKHLTSAQLDAFANYADFVVRSLKGRIWGYQIWNEWDAETGGFPPGLAKDYMLLARRIAPIIRQADPDSKIIATSVMYRGLKDGWLDTALALGLADVVDGIAIHPYVQPFGPGRDSPAAMMRWIDEVVAKANLGRNRRLSFYATEFGWTVTPGMPIATVAKYSGEAFRLLKQSQALDGFWWYDLQDDGPNTVDPESNFGLLDVNLNPKPAYFSVKKALGADR